MEAPTGLHKLRGPSPIVWAMRTRVAPPPQLAEAIPRPVYPPPPPPQAPLPPTPPERRRRGRPRKCDSLPPPPGFAPLPSARPSPPPAAQGKGKLDGLQPHVLTIPTGEDIIARVMGVSRLTSKAVCILSALGAVQEAFLLQPSGVILNHKGPLEIIRLSGSILTSNDHPSLRVTLASVNSFVLSGVIAGPLIAATPVQAILGSFHNAVVWPNNAPRAAPSTQGNRSIPPSGSSSPETAAFWPNSAPTATVACNPNSEHSHPDSASCAWVEQNGSSEIDVKPSVGMHSPRYAACTSAEPSEMDFKPYIGVSNSVGVISASQVGTEVHALDS